MVAHMKGYIALTSVLMITAFIMLAGIFTMVSAIDTIQASFADYQSEDALQNTESCIEDALLYLNKNNALPLQVNGNGGSCSVTINSQNGNSTTFTIAGNKQSYYKIIQVTVSRTTLLTVLAWSQL